MSSLRDKLKRHIKSEHAGEAKEAEPSLRAKAEDLVSEDAASQVNSSAGEPAGWEHFDMRVEHNENGSFLMRRRTYPLPYRHGRYELGEFMRSSGELLALSAGKEVAAERVLFLDTETTGLGVGAGNVPFMIGIGYYADGAFIVEQLFIRNLAEELAMLVYLDSLLLDFTHLVTYNGRSFDWPVVKNRFVLNRARLRNEAIGQLDFLYPARSLWRTVLSTCRLSVVEEEKLGFSREDDVPGSLAPSLYFQYLAEGKPETVKPVFVHNEHDILSLAALAVHLTDALAGRVSFTEMEPEELYRTGLWLENKGRPQLADEAFERLLGVEEAGRVSYAGAVAPIYKKRGDEDRAVALWEQAVASFGSSPLGSVEPFIELSMHYEHKRKDYARALEYAEEAKELSMSRAALERDSHRMKKERAALDELAKRIERLRRKLEGRGAFRRGARASGGPETMSLF